MLNQSRGYWLLSDALASTISLCMELESERIELEERVRVAPRLDFDTKLLLLCARMHNQVVRILSPFLSFMHSYKPASAHNMLALMLDPRHKELALMGSYLGRDFAIRIVQVYDDRLLLPLLIFLYWKRQAPTL